MRIKYLAIALAVTTGLLFTVSTAHAKGKPLKVDCDLLASTISAVDEFLDNNTDIAFNSLGDLVASALLDGTTFNQLNSLIVFFSGGAINFDSVAQALSTISKCGLTPLLIDEIMD